MLKELARRPPGAHNQKHFIRKTRQDNAVGNRQYGGGVQNNELELRSKLLQNFSETLRGQKVHRIRAASRAEKYIEFTYFPDVTIRVPISGIRQ